jgi:pimeloyl-ACP methyl ester carboxylesterase
VKSKTVQIISIMLLVIVILVLGTGIAGAIAKANMAKQNSAPGQLVDVGGYKMHINCTGQGSPTVILEAGMGSSYLSWALVQPEVARFARVCSYDRAGYGWSEPSPHPRTAIVEVEELHTLLVNANIEGPYVLVGHSLGGMNVRVYAHNYPDEVVAIILVDSFHEERPIRNPELAKLNQASAGQYRLFMFLSSTGLMALLPQTIPNPGFPADVYTQYQAVIATGNDFETTVVEMNAVEESSAEVRALKITSLGDMPLIVLSAGSLESIPSLSEAENQHLREEMQAQQSELAALSSNSKHVIAEQSGHMIQFDQPNLVIDAIREVVVAFRK